MNNIILKLKLDFPNNHTDTLDELHKLIDSISNTVSNDALIHKINVLCNFMKVISINEDDDSYVFNAYSTHGVSILAIPKNSPITSMSQSDWNRATDIMLKHCMGITSNVTNTLISDFKNHLQTIENSSDDMSDLFYKYTKAVTNIKVFLFPTTAINAQRPKKILEAITIDVKNKAFDVVRQKIFDRTISHVSHNEI